MSGIEVAGLVLAAIPILVSAQEHFGPRLQARVDGLRNKERRLKQFINDLDFYGVKLLFYVQAVLARTDLSIHDQTILLSRSNLGGPLWRQNEVALEVDRVLSGASASFRNNLDRIVNKLVWSLRGDAYLGDATNQGKLETLRALVALNRTALGQQNPKKVPRLIRSTWDRVKFAWNVPAHQETLEEIGRCTTSIGELLAALETAERFHTAMQTRQAHLAYEVRREVRRLAEVLNRTCTCQPQPECVTRIRLRRRDDVSDAASHTSFDLRLEDTACEISISVAKDRNLQQQTVTQHALVEDICRSIRNENGVPQRVDFDIGADLSLRQLRSTPIEHQDTAPEFIGLHNYFEALQRDNATLNNLSMQRLLKEKHILATILAHSLLHILDSPWHYQSWDSRGVYLLKSPQVRLTFDAQSDGFGQILRNPFISATLRQPNQLENFELGGLLEASTAYDFTAIALGIMLLEIHVGRPLLEELSVDGRLRYLATRRAEDLHYKEQSMSMDYFKAVMFCFYPNQMMNKFDDITFREQYFSKVLAGLDADLRINYEISEHFWRT